MNVGKLLRFLLMLALIPIAIGLGLCGLFGVAVGVSQLHHPSDSLMVIVLGLLGLGTTYGLYHAVRALHRSLGDAPQRAAPHDDDRH